MSPVNIIRWIALAVAVIAAFVAVPYAGLAMVVLGAALGFMGVGSDERVDFEEVQTFRLGRPRFVQDLQNRLLCLWVLFQQLSQKGLGTSCIAIASFQGGETADDPGCLGETLQGDGAVTPLCSNTVRQHACRRFS